MCDVIESNNQNEVNKSDYLPCITEFDVGPDNINETNTTKILHDSSIDETEVSLHNSSSEEGLNDKETPSLNVPCNDDSSSEDTPEVTSHVPSSSNNLYASSGCYHLPFRHNGGKPPVCYSLDIERKRSRYPVLNYVATQRLAEPERNSAIWCLFLKSLLIFMKL